MILVAAVGNLWLGDDGFAYEVAKRLRARELSTAMSRSPTSAQAASTSRMR